MLYVIKVTDPRHPTRVGWIGWKGTKKEGSQPVGLHPFPGWWAANDVAKVLRKRFPSAKIDVMQLLKKGAKE